MKITYVSPARIPTERPHGYAMAKMCESFASLGNDVTLVSPSKTSFMGADTCAYYNLQRNFRHKRVRALDFLYWEKLGGTLSFLLDIASFAVAFLLSNRALVRETELLYTRDPYIAALMPSQKTMLELHTLPAKSWLMHRLLRRVRRLAVISHGLAADVRAFCGREEIIVLPDAVDLARFARMPEQAEARELLGLHAQGTIAAYTGNFYSWKGVDTLADAAKLLPEVQVVLVGGTDEYDYQRIAAKAAVVSNLTARRFEDASRMPAYLAAADVLVIPNAKGTAISERHTSPLKLFEYMAAGRPIVASDLPSLREILDTDTAVFFTPDDPVSLAHAIKTALDPDRARVMVEECKKRIGVYSWDARAAAALKGL